MNLFPSKLNRKNNFDGIRIIASVLVLCSHMFALSGRWEPRFLGDHSFGNLGVLIFFSISGYLVTASWVSDPDSKRFLIRRFLRIIPGLFVAVIVSYITIRLLGLSGFPKNPLHAFNGSLWTIPYEIYFYLFICVIGVLTNSFSLMLLFGAFVAFTFLPESFLSYFGLFFAGGAILKQYPVLRKGTFLIAFAAMSLVYLWLDNTIIGLAFIIPPLTIWVGTQSWPILNKAGIFGDLSYGIYIYAWPVQQIIVALLGKNTSYFQLLATSLLAVLLLAWLSWHFVEKPSLNLKPLKRKPTLL